MSTKIERPQIIYTCLKNALQSLVVNAILGYFKEILPSFSSVKNFQSVSNIILAPALSIEL